MKAGPAPDIVVVGSINMDLVMCAPRLPLPGEALPGTDFAIVPGGKGGNQAVAAARLGAGVAMIGCVGADPYGVRLLACLEAEGIDCTGVLTNHILPSGVAMVAVDEASQNAIITVAGSNGEVSPELVAVHRATLARAKMIVCEMEVPSVTVEAALFAAREFGVPSLLNASPVNGPLPSRWLEAVDYLVVNEIEAATLSGLRIDSIEDAKAAAEALHGRGALHVLITLGARGVVALFNESSNPRCEFYAAREVKAVDTTAAGDTFVGAFASAITGGRSHAAAVSFGQAAASLSVTRRGAQPSIPYLHELVHTGIAGGENVRENEGSSDDSRV